MKYFLFIALLFVNWGVSLASNQDKSHAPLVKEEEPTLESVLALKDPSLPGTLRTYYTPGYASALE